MELSNADGLYRKYRIPFLALALIQNCLAAGIFYGWAALSELLVGPQVNAYRELCGSAEIDLPCEAQKKKMHLVYTISQSTNLFGSLVTGMILDYFGPRICSALSLLGVTAGMSILGLSAWNRIAFENYLAAMILIGFSGPGVQVALFHLSNLFPKYESTISVLISGTFQLGFLVFLVFKKLNDWFGITLFMICNVYSFVLLVLSVLSVLSWPNTPLSQNNTEDPLTENYLEQNVGLIDKVSTERAESDVVIDSDIKDSALSLTVREVFSELARILFSTSFILLLFYAILGIFWANYYIGTVSSQLASIYGEAESSRFVDLFNTLLIVGVFSIPFYGAFTDRYGFGPSILMSVSFGVLYAILASFKMLGLQVVTFVIYAFYRTFLFSSIFAFVASEFGFQFFGALTGILFLTASVVCSGQYALVRAFGADYLRINYVQLGSLALTLVFPVHVLRKQFARKKRSISAIYEVIPCN